MSVILHWWLIPVAILLAACWLAKRLSGGGGYFPNVFPALALILGVLMAGAMVLEHFL